MSVGRSRVTFVDAALRERRERIEERVVVARLDSGGEVLDLADIGTAVRREAERPSGEFVMNGIGKHESSSSCFGVSDSGHWPPRTGGQRTLYSSCKGTAISSARFDNHSVARNATIVTSSSCGLP